MFLPTPHGSCIPWSQVHTPPMCLLHPRAKRVSSFPSLHPKARKMPPSPSHHPRVMIKASPPSLI